MVSATGSGIWASKMKWFQTRLLWRVYAGYVVIIVLLTLIISVLIGRQVSDNSSREIHQSLTVLSELLAEIARQGLLQSDATLQETIVKLGDKTDSRFTVIADNGLVVADSRESPTNMDNHSRRPEIIEARESGFSITSRFSETLQQHMIYRAVRVTLDDQNIGFVRISLPLKSVDEKLAQLRSAAFLGASIAGFAALILGFYFAKRFSDPLINMTEAAEAISRGDYDRRISIRHQDELGTLAQSFNRMAKSSAERMMEITADRNRLAKIFSSMVEGIISVDQHQKIVQINQTAAALLDLSVQDSLNKPISDVLRNPEIISSLPKAIETQESVKSQLRKPFRERDLVVDVSVVSLRDEDGHGAGAVIVLHDVSEVDRLAMIRRDFVANASHELKTPITAIRGLTETILDDEQMPTTIRTSFINKISVQSLRLSSLVSDLITISRLESDLGAGHHQRLDFAEIIQRSVAELRPVCLEKKLHLHMNKSGENFEVSGDSQELKQLADNLLDNAIKYTPEGGDISITIKAYQSTIEFSVNDTGIGISPSYQQRIFERFYRVDKARSRELGGTGLGLSIVKNIVEQHSGLVSVQSQPGKGSTFTVSLPLAS